MIGRTLSHYQVLEKIGEGGMGEVYLAKETKQDRDVAAAALFHNLQSREKRKGRQVVEGRDWNENYQPDCVMQSRRNSFAPVFPFDNANIVRLSKKLDVV